MRRVWRLVTARYAETAFSGEGARRYGGRWNPKGVPVIYTAGSLCRKPWKPKPLLFETE